MQSDDPTVSVAYEIPPGDNAEPAFGHWLQGEMTKKGVTIGGLVEKTGITYTGIWNIVNGKTLSPRKGDAGEVSGSPPGDSAGRDRGSDRKRGSSASGAHMGGFHPERP
jgi:hypothetical protein